MKCTKCKKRPKAKGNNSWCNQCLKEAARKYRAKHKKYYSDLQKQQRRRLKLELINEYGGKCECCGETHIEFLSIDHVYNNGADHRREIHKQYGTKKRGGTAIYKWLRANSYPKDGYRVLCFNCNAAHGFYGYCPHKEKRPWLQEININDYGTDTNTN